MFITQDPLDCLLRQVSILSRFHLRQVSLYVTVKIEKAHTVSITHASFVNHLPMICLYFIKQACIATITLLTRWPFN